MKKIIISFLLASDPTQRRFCESLKKISRQVKYGAPKIPAGFVPSEGVSLMKDGAGPLMFDTTIQQLHSLGYKLVAAHRKYGKVSFVAAISDVDDSQLAAIFIAMTEDSGWTVKRYENPGSIDFAAMNPINRRAQIERAAGKGRQIEVTRVTIA